MLKIKVQEALELVMGMNFNLNQISVCVLEGTPIFAEYIKPNLTGKLILLVYFSERLKLQN